MMEKTLFVLRHAEAANAFGGTDHERPLTDNGRAAAARLGGVMRGKNYGSAKILCSPARRTRETCAALGFADVPVSYEESIYNAAPGNLLSLIHAAGDAPSLLLIGHNPGVAALVQVLSGEIVMGYAPATLSVLRFDAASWADIAPGTGTLIETIVP